jgi:hypothetical protein
VFDRLNFDSSSVSLSAVIHQSRGGCSAEHHSGVEPLVRGQRRNDNHGHAFAGHEESLGETFGIADQADVQRLDP